MQKRGECNMNLKKVIATFAVASMLVGCGGSGSSSDELKEGDTIKIG